MTGDVHHDFLTVILSTDLQDVNSHPALPHHSGDLIPFIYRILGFRFKVLSLVLDDHPSCGVLLL